MSAPAMRGRSCVLFFSSSGLAVGLFGRASRIGDEVQYKLPFYPLGEIAFPVVRLRLARIF